MNIIYRPSLTLTELFELRLLLRHRISSNLQDVRRNKDFYGKEWANDLIKGTRKLNHILIKLYSWKCRYSMTHHDAIREFINNNPKGFNDYWEMQFAWSIFTDELQRNGNITERQRTSWNNPCKPETFKTWNKKHFK